GVGRVHAVTLAPDAAAGPLLTGRSYREVRRFWEMTIELGDDPPPEPLLPEGFWIESFSSELARAFHGALEEAFAQHWQYQPEPFEEWWERQVARPDHDPSLWFVARTGEGVAAATRNDPERSGGGWIGALGVRADWRGRGLAKGCCFAASGSSTSAGSAGSASVSTPRTQPVRRSCTRASEWWSTPSRSSGRR